MVIQAIVERPLNPQKFTVLCALWPEVITGSYFFKNKAVDNAIANGKCYRAMVKDFFELGMENVYVDDLWFQQYDATWHTANETINF